MRFKKIVIVYILILISSSVITIPISSQEEVIPFWNREWSYRQEIQLPISTNETYAKYQPIDIRIRFDESCWTKNETETSVRVCCWDGQRWHELESQIYDLEGIGVDHILECSLVFLVPEIADGKEKYYVYYDDHSKPSPNYIDHVSVEDSYYFYRPVTDISAEATYYSIKQDGYCIYGVGQEGKILDRAFSQLVVKQKNNTEEFEALNSDQIASFAFSYYYGDKEKDESSSDQSFIHKEIFVDGNLMVEFGISSGSNRKDIKTTAIYKYYYSPMEEKRISARVRHKILEEVVVQGKENIDGRYGALISIKSRNNVIEKLNAGEILPNLYFYGEDDVIEEYQMNTNPESEEREWIISFKDDADLGDEAWIANCEGMEGKINSIIFSSYKDVVKSGTDERDGIQLKVTEKEYFDFLGTEVDYASINFGRNSYEKGYSHDLEIPEGFIVEFDAELFSSKGGGYKSVQKEAEIFQELVKHRHIFEDTSFEKEPKKYDLTVITHFGGTKFSHPWLANRTGRRFPVMWIELYQNDNLITSGSAVRSFFIRAYKTFSDIPEGDYLIKIYLKIDNATKFFNGAKVITLDEDKKVHVFCTWQRHISLIFQDQNDQAIEGIRVVLLNKDDFVLSKNTTDNTGKALLNAPYNLRDPYYLKAFYRDFILYEGEIQSTLRNIKVDFNIGLYDLTVEVRDTFDFSPGVEITPALLGSGVNSTIQMIPEEIEPGLFLFENIPSGEYKLQINYANFIQERFLDIPDDGDFISIRFDATFDLYIDLFDLRGNPLINEEVNFQIIRLGKQVYASNEKIFSLPPASYTIKAYSKGDLVGLKDISLTNSKTVKIVTTLKSIIPTLILVLALIFIGIILLLTFFKRLTLNSLFKLLTVAFIVIALIQPWWELSGSSVQPTSERSTRMYMNPQIMIESTSFEGKTFLDIAEMPELFIDLLGKLVLITYAICILFGISFLSSMLKKKRYSVLFNLLGIILLIVILSTFYTGTSKLTEVSIGNVQGEGILSVSFGEETVLMPSTWGFGIGFYLVIASFILALCALFLELKPIFVKLTK